MCALFARLLRTPGFLGGAKLPGGGGARAASQRVAGALRGPSRPTFERSQQLLTLQLKRKPPRPRPPEARFAAPGVYRVAAYPTAEEIDLEGLVEALRSELAYTAEHILESLDVIRATAPTRPGCEPQEIYVFREGAVVLWNVPAAAVPAILERVHPFGQHRYAEHVVRGDSETMGYTYNYGQEEYVGVTDRGELVLSASNPRWEKYVASHVLAGTVKLAVWERQLEKYVRNIEFISEDLKYGRRIRLTQERVLRKHGALFALRHVVNLSSALLEPPQLLDYPTRLDGIHHDLTGRFAVANRLRVLREKMNHCLELIMLLTTYLRDRHRLRLEWLVITLIVVELAFEAFYCVDRFMN